MEIAVLSICKGYPGIVFTSKVDKCMTLFPVAQKFDVDITVFLKLVKQGFFQLMVLNLKVKIPHAERVLKFLTLPPDIGVGNIVMGGRVVMPPASSCSPSPSAGVSPMVVVSLSPGVLLGLATKRSPRSGIIGIVFCPQPLFSDLAVCFVRALFVFASILARIESPTSTGHTPSRSGGRCDTTSSASSDFTLAF
jgi:hypothetical protein